MGGDQTHVHRPTGLIGEGRFDVFEDKSGDNAQAAELVRACLLFTLRRCYAGMAQNRLISNKWDYLHLGLVVDICLC